jgi:hypothetical protein
MFSTAGRLSCFWQQLSHQSRTGITPHLNSNSSQLTQVTSLFSFSLEAWTPCFPQLVGHTAFASWFLTGSETWISIPLFKPISWFRSNQQEPLGVLPLGVLPLCGRMQIDDGL